ncbi:MAG: hypothetical protein GY708_07330, partial [Actinomycetia bacterium]|nr:hypothetical protein [Actinomycetes bacterium]
MRHRWDDFELDTASRRLVGLAGDVHIEPQVFDVLLLLVEERDRVVPKEEILDAVWGDQFVSESALTTRIKEARRALGDDGRTQKYIRNAHGHGYQFVGVVDALASPVHSTAPNEAAAPVPLRLAIDITVDDEFPFVGRTAELVAAESLLEEARRVGARLFIGGPPGVGKSRLA